MSHGCAQEEKPVMRACIARIGAHRQRLTVVLSISCLLPMDAAIATDVRRLRRGSTGDTIPGKRLP
jgi:hypothetical protein